MGRPEVVGKEENSGSTDGELGRFRSRYICGFSVCTKGGVCSAAKRRNRINSRGEESTSGEGQSGVWVTLKRNVGVSGDMRVESFGQSAVNI